jgi:hypothetical protein
MSAALETTIFVANVVPFGRFTVTVTMLIVFAVSPSPRF